MGDLPLDGVRVIDLTEVWAGPMGTSMLGDMGADVVRVESFPRLSVMRPLLGLPGRPGFSDDRPDEPRPWERYARYHMANRNKRAVAINLKSPRGLEILRALARNADVIVDGYSSGSLARLGFNPEQLLNEHERLIYVSTPGWGSDGDYSGYVTMGSGLDAYTGHMWARGYEDGDPLTTNDGYQSDVTAALAIVIGVCAALNKRRRTGRGGHIDIAQYETMLPSLAYFYLQAQSGEPVRRFENRHPVHSPQAAYRCAGTDEWIVISIRDDVEWASLCSAMSREDLVRSYPTRHLRAHHGQEIDQAINQWTRRWTKERLMEFLQARGVAAGAVRRESEVLDDPGLADYWQTVPHEFAGPRRHAGGIWQLDGNWVEIRRPPNLYGEHNSEVLSELGYSTKMVSELYTDGVLADSDTLTELAGQLE